MTSLTGVIHTPAPATPLCTEGEVSKELVHSSVYEDPARAFTVQARTTILRDFLQKGGALYILYPEKGIELRNPQQQEIYKNIVNRNQSNLFDCPLKCDSIDTSLVGAYYLFKDGSGKEFAFAIKMTQANNPQDQGNFGLWLGEAAKSPVQDRIEEVRTLFKYSPYHTSL